ncbi:MAG: tetratricopeptide repeat protein [Spirochaetaceae bacterium]|nr:tetratricopeptide repeat protein [Spirochaetaceae bacterium]
MKEGTKTPSLAQLEEFKQLLVGSGNEDKVLAELGKKPPEVALPENEPPPLPEPESPVKPGEPSEPFALSSGLDFDFSSFTDARPAENAPPPPPPDTPLETPGDTLSPPESPLETPDDTFSPPESALETPDDTFSPPESALETPDDTLSGLEDALAGLGEDFQMPVSGEDGAVDDGAGDSSGDFDLDMDALQDSLGGGGDGAGDDGADFDGFGVDLGGFGGDTGGGADAPAGAEDDFDLDLSGFGTAGGDDAFPADGLDSAPGDDDFNLDFDALSGLGDDDGADGAGGAPAADAGEPVVLPDDFGVGASDEEMASLTGGGEDGADTGVVGVDAGGAGMDDIEPLETRTDPFDSFDPSKSGMAEADEMPDIDSFAIPGVDTPKAPEVAAKPEQIEAFKISDKELKALLDTLSTYPLNVRVACEEAIAEEVLAPAQLKALTKMLSSGANAQEASRLVSKILGKRVAVPKGYKTGEELEAEQSSFVYVFKHKFFPIIRLFTVIAVLAACASYLTWYFIVNPLIAEGLYKKGYEIIAAGDPDEYRRANQYFSDAFEKHRVKAWFYRYAELFRDYRQYLYAREKYDELLYYYPHDKKGALDYAAMEAFDLRNYEKADRLIRTEILDYKIDDQDGLLSLGDINLEWAEIAPERYEEARAAYARLIALYGHRDPILERMLLYFIRTDKLSEVLPLQAHFMGNNKTRISAPTLAELGGYLLDKRFETAKGVPDENIEYIEGIKDVLIRAEKAAPALPEPHYHLARYYNYYAAPVEERFTLEAAAAAFDNAERESAKRTSYRIDTQRRLASMMVKNHQFIPAENELVKGVNIYEDAVRRGLLTRKPEYGKLYADLGDLEYFAKDGALENAARYYLQSEANGYLPPEIEYRLGNTYYRREDYPAAFQRFFNVSRELPFNRRLLYAMGNTAYQNADFFAAEGYYKKLLDTLETERDRIPPNTLPDNLPEHNNLIQRLLWAENNMGVTMNALALRTGRSDYKRRALTFLSDAILAGDALERDRSTMIRPSFRDPRLPGVNLPSLNMQYILYPTPADEAQIYVNVDSDVIEPSDWEERMTAAAASLTR